MKEFVKHGSSMDDRSLFDEDDGALNLADVDIEASILCEVNDWLKRKRGAGVDDRKEFLQNALNNMVTFVRPGFMVILKMLLYHH